MNWYFRADRDKYIRIIKRNVKDNSSHIFAKFALMNEKWPYDCLSLMHGSHDVNSDEGKITVKAKKHCYKKCVYAN